MAKVNLDSKEFNTARVKGYIPNNVQESWSESFVGKYVTKYPNRTMDLDIMREVTDVKMPNWCNLTEKNLKNYRDAVLERVSSNTARTTFARIKSVLNDMKNEVELPTLRFEDILKAKKEPSQNVYLTEEEIERLDAVATDGEREQYVKSLCLIACYTGCRHSDAIRISEENIDKHTNTLSYVSQKTKVQAVVPIHRNLMKYLFNYNREIEMWDWEFNNIARSLCKKANICEKVKLYHGGKETIKEKYEYVASHTFRRTFATILYLKGCDVPTIGRMMGHTGNLQITMGYICGYKEISTQAMSFFN